MVAQTYPSSNYPTLPKPTLPYLPYFADPRLALPNATLHFSTLADIFLYYLPILPILATLPYLNIS